jgi:benzodiazapine receptor
MNKIKIYIKSIAIPVIIGGIVGFAISSSIDYNSLERPFLSPPSIAFPIVWSILYLLMGVSYGILKSKKLTTTEIDWIYYIQLGVNSLWSIFFFLAKWRLFSFIWIIILAILIIVMILKFYNKNKLAALLQIPYLLWVLFASYLNIAIYILNK